MDKDHIKRLLNKINALFQVFMQENQELSKIEKDLLLEYIRELYEHLSTGSDYTAENHDSFAESFRTRVPTQTKKQSVAQNEENHITVVEVESESEAGRTETENAENEDLKELFRKPETKDLSDRLSMVPIKDLSKAVGINERIINIKVLFGGDNQVYERVISALNNFVNFNEASEYLMKNVAEKYHWASDPKSSKAANFIKLVRRRYL